MFMFLILLWLLYTGEKNSVGNSSSPGSDAFYPVCIFQWCSPPDPCLISVQPSLHISFFFLQQRLFILFHISHGNLDSIYRYKKVGKTVRWSGYSPLQAKTNVKFAASFIYTAELPEIRLEILASAYCLNNKSGRFFAGLNLGYIEILCIFPPYFVFKFKKFG